MTAVLGPGRPFTGNERELLESTLELHRVELVAAVQGLTDAQARQSSCPPPRPRFLGSSTAPPPNASGSNAQTDGGHRTPSPPARRSAIHFRCTTDGGTPMSDWPVAGCA
jgi:hypothetical protein